MARRGVARLLPPLGVALGGLAVLVGSFARWGGCRQMPCDPGDGVAFFVLVDYSGLDLGFGVVTVLSGLAMAIVGLLALGERRVRNPRRLVAICTTIVLATMVAVVTWDFVFHVRSIDGPKFGVYIVIAGAVLAAVAGAPMPPGTEAPTFQVGRADQDAKVIAEAKQMLRDGWGEAEVIDFLRDSGLTWIRSVRALSLATGKGVGYAKPAVLNSDTWADERPAIDAMHEQIIKMVERHGRDAPFGDDLCQSCGKSLMYSESHDATFCPVEDEWRENQCADPTCPFCRPRPTHPSQSMSVSS